MTPMILILTTILSFLIFIVTFFFLPAKRRRSIASSFLKISRLIRGIITSYWVIKDCPTLILNIYWFFPFLRKFSLSFIVDYYFIIFRFVALFVTWSIIEFSHYYMENDPFNQSFFKTLILFLLFMLLLVSSKRLFLLFIGWEGVGILSFILIGWWFTRRDAKSAALQAIIYKRIGDRGMILFLLLSMIQLNSWKLNEISLFTQKTNLSKWALIGIIIAATGKSAQFTLHPWLPSAMEGPTPVSALLHSSTMVVAGIFLLVRCTPILNTTNWALPTIRILGSLTALFAARAALTQFDIKKVIAYSTTRQLGIMAFSVGLNLPWLALFHICTHAFFKALLFLCSGRIIHSLKKEQDLRKMGARRTILPITSRALTVARLALCGIPFLAGYYSKDLILEAGQYKISKNVRIILALVATLITAAYSSRLIYFLSLKNRRTKTISPYREENPKLTYPLLRLLIGVFIIGWILSLIIFHNYSLTVPLINKKTPLIISITSALITLFFSFPMFYKTFIYLANNWFFVNLTHSLFLINTIKIRLLGVLRSIDQGWNSTLISKSIPKSLPSLSLLFSKAQTGKISTYFFYFIIISGLIFIIIII